MANSTDDKIKNRESWLKIIIIILVVIVFCWKIIDESFKIDISDSSFSDLVSILLAIFAIWLSVIFYFKASETSNLFYDNTYKFTEEISIILGRIEAGFGERLKHLDEGYTGLRDSLPLYINLDKAKKELEDDQKELQKIEKERANLIEELTTKARLQEHEKQEFMKQLKKKDEEIASLVRELHFLKRRLERAEATKHELVKEYREEFVEFTKRVFIDLIGLEAIQEAPVEIIRRRFKRVKDELPIGYINELKQYGFINEDNNLTVKGITWLREIVNS